MRLPWTPIPDDEYVERVRRTIAIWGRFRILLLLLNLLIICGIVWLVIKGVELLLQMVQPANAPAVALVYVMAWVFGHSFGWMLSHAVHGLIFSLSGFRSERLLLKYYDRQSATIAYDDPDIADDPQCVEPEYADFYQDDP